MKPLPESYPSLDPNSRLFLDRGQALRGSAAAELVLPQSDCTKHLWGNVKKLTAYKRASKEQKVALKKHYFDATKALLKPQCDKALMAIKTISADIHTYLTTENTSLARWTTAYATAPRRGRTTNQGAESINSVLRGPRSFMPPNMISAARTWWLTKGAERKKLSADHLQAHGPDSLVPKAEAYRLQVLERATRNQNTGTWVSLNINAGTARMRSASTAGLIYDVQINDLARRSCCGYTYENGKPCWHQVALAQRCGRDPTLLFSPDFKSSAWCKQYQYAPAEDDLERLCPEFSELEPRRASLGHAAVPVPSGRPKSTKRVHSAMDDEGGGGRSARAPCGRCGSWAHVTKRCFQCGRCSEWGHKTTTCRTGLPAGFAYIACTKARPSGSVHKWDSEKQAGRR